MDSKREVKAIEYMCNYCGQKRLRAVNGGRPDPGKCPRRQGDQPHRWVQNKKIYK